MPKKFVSGSECNHLFPFCPSCQRRSQEFDLGGYKWFKETKQPHKKLRYTDLGGIYTDIPPVATALPVVYSMINFQRDSNFLLSFSSWRKLIVLAIFMIFIRLNLQMFCSLTVSSSGILPVNIVNCRRRLT